MNNWYKYLMFFFNLLIFISGFALLGIGIWVQVEGESFKQIVSNMPIIFSGVYILLAVGAVLVIVGFLGCCGAIQENKCMLGTFFVFVLIIFLAEISGGVLTFIYYPLAIDEAFISMTKYHDDTAEGKTIKAGWHAFQTTFTCCGINGIEDWISTHRETTLVPPCSLSKHVTGCADAIQRYFWVLGGVALGILLIELLAMIFSCFLYRSI